MKDSSVSDPESLDHIQRKRGHGMPDVPAVHSGRVLILTVLGLCLGPGPILVGTNHPCETLGAVLSPSSPSSHDG
jgi:hypothetical protein